MRLTAAAKELDNLKKNVDQLHDSYVKSEDMEDCDERETIVTQTKKGKDDDDAETSAKEDGI